MAKCFYCLGNHSTNACVKQSIDNVGHNVQETGTDLSDAIGQVSGQLSEINQNLLDGLSRVEGSIQQLHTFLLWSQSEVIWRMERQVELLTGIHSMIQNPRATQGNELYKMGADSFKRNRLDDAIKLLLEAREMNPLDYRVHITLGHVYARTGDSTKAKESFQAAVDYARTDEYKKDALLLLCRGLRCLGQTEQAITAARQASLLAPKDSPAHYELASCMTEKLKETDSTG